jgi:peptidoglycan hydrolase-like protein with peptidoglycan-binding domain
VLTAGNVPRVNVNSINFQVNTGVVVPSNFSVVSVSTYPALIDTFPAYRDDSFFVVDDEVVFVDRDRRIVDVVPAGPRTHFSSRHSGGSFASAGGGSAAVNLAPDDIRTVQQVLIERGLLHGEADGVLGPQTHEALMTFQRQQGIQVSGSIDASTVTSLGVSNRLSAQASQSLNQTQSTQTQSTTTGQQGQAAQPQAPTAQNAQTPSQQNATGQPPAQNTGQATNAPAQPANQPATTTGQAPPAQQGTTGQAAPPTQGTTNAAPATQNAPAQAPSTGSGMNPPAQSNTPSR